jgi:hypothetical protein
MSFNVRGHWVARACRVAEGLVHYEVCCYLCWSVMTNSWSVMTRNMTGAYCLFSLGTKWRNSLIHVTWILTRLLALVRMIKGDGKMV